MICFIGKDTKNCAPGSHPGAKSCAPAPEVTPLRGVGYAPDGHL